MEKVQLISTFVEKVKSYFAGAADIGYEYLDIDDSFKIWHTYSNYESPEFREFLGKCIKEILLTNKVYNFFISYEKRDEVIFVSNLKTRNHYGTGLWSVNYEALQNRYLIKQDARLDYSMAELINPSSELKIVPSQYIENCNVFYKEGLAA